MTDYIDNAKCTICDKKIKITVDEWLDGVEHFCDECDGLSKWKFDNDGHKP